MTDDTRDFLVYPINELPDRFSSAHQRQAAGDVQTAAARDYEHFLRALGFFPPQSVSLTVRFICMPTHHDNLQERLKIFLIGRAHDVSLYSSLSSLIEHGPLKRFFNLTPNGDMTVPWDKMNAACDMLRRESAVEPLYATEFNPSSPSAYYTCAQFKPNAQNDYLVLDSILGNQTETVVIDLSVEPTDVSFELKEHTRYLARLESINRPRDDETDLDRIDFLKSGHARQIYSRQVLRPLRRKDPLADDILRTQNRFHESLQRSHLLFAFRVFAETEPTARLVAGTVAESAFDEGCYRLLSYSRKDPAFHTALEHTNKARIFLVPAHDRFLVSASKDPYKGLERLGHAASVDELVGIIRLPVAGYTSPSCIRKNTDPVEPTGKDKILLGYDLNSLTLPALRQGKGLIRAMALDSLVKHVFVSGMSGSGKTTAVINLLIQLGVPFLVLDPVKTGYSVLKRLKKHPDPKLRRLAKKLKIYTAGNNLVSPFRFNPLKSPPGTSRHEHIANIHACLLAAFGMPGPVYAVLAEALEQVYEDFPDPDRPPLMSDLLAAAERILEKKHYSSETASDIRAAIDVRLRLLTQGLTGQVFQCRESIPNLENCLKSPTVLQMDCLPQAQACLLTFFILTAIRQHVKAFHKPDGHLQFAIVIEEAHNLVGRDTNASPSEGIADPKAFAAEYICRMLAELREFGVSMIIVDQNPSSVAPQVLKNTGTKIAFRQMAQEDREDIAGSMLFGQIETQEIARLKTGEAFLITEGYEGPRRILTFDLQSSLKLGPSPRNCEIRELIKDDDWYKKHTEARMYSELTNVKEALDRFDEKTVPLMKDLVDLRAGYVRTSSQKHVARSDTRLLAHFQSRRLSIRRNLDSTYDAFLFGPYRLFQASDLHDLNTDDGPFGNMYRQLVRRVHEVVLDRRKHLVRIAQDLVETTTNPDLERNRS